MLFTVLLSLRPPLTIGTFRGFIFLRLLNSTKTRRLPFYLPYNGRIYFLPLALFICLHVWESLVTLMTPSRLHTIIIKERPLAMTVAVATVAAAAVFTAVAATTTTVTTAAAVAMIVVVATAAAAAAAAAGMATVMKAATTGRWWWGRL
jgi:hypothetical protein